MLRAQPVLPSPMCGISDYAFRQTCRRFAGPLAYTQMVSAWGIAGGDRKTHDILDLAGEEPILGMQLFGSDPEKLAASAARLQRLGADVVDLNMGCPARRVTNGCGGSALLRMPDLVREILRAMRAALTIPFTAKMRWDWDDDAGASLRIAEIAEGEGVDGLCLHARTRKEAYSGRADWSRIAQLKRAVSIPVVGNGDVRSPADAVRMIAETGCDGVMIGRGAIGDPWLLGACLAAVRGEAPAALDCEPTWAERRRVMLDHAARMVESRGERRGVVLFRKHAAQYLRGVRGVRRMRVELMRVEDLGGLARVLPETQPDPEPEDACAEPVA
jgi:nifR3 family TIM-barrel protein